MTRGEPWQPYREPLASTLLRTSLIAVAVGIVFAWSLGKVSLWPYGFLMALWPSFGGHWIEIGFLNWLRPRLPVERFVQVCARLATWFIGGVILVPGVQLTAAVLGWHGARSLHWWIGGLAFIAIELVAHVALQLRGLRNFYNGRG
jgi:hypothetical protein